MKTNVSLAALTAALFGVIALAPLPGASANQGPVPLSQPEPVYPHRQFQSQIEGAVLVHYHVNLQGEATNAVVLKSTDPAFEAAALEAVRHWKFTPAMSQGVPVDTPVLQLVTFTLPDRSPATPATVLAAQLQPRVNAVELAQAIKDPCYCGSGKPFAECHRENLVVNESGVVALGPLPAAPAGHRLVVVAQPAPFYPHRQYQNKIEGAVLVHYHVNSLGNTIDAVVLKSTDPAFEAPTLEAVRHWKFEPRAETAAASDTPVLQLVTFTVPDGRAETPSKVLVSQLRPRTTAAELTQPISDLCWCGSGKKFADCHREMLAVNDQ